MTKTIEIKPVGRLGNQMFQYLVAKVMQQHVPDAIITGYSIPEFNLRGPANNDRSSDFDITTHKFDFDTVLGLLSNRANVKVRFLNLTMRMEYLNLPLAREIFPIDPTLRTGFDERHIVFNIRLGDILKPNIHANYRPMPIAWYEHLLSSSGKAPVFLGELGSDPYSEELKRRFPRADFVSNKNPMDDFNMLRTSRNIVLAVSTFSWLAGWLSETAEQITLPVSGIFNPAERPDIYALPSSDNRYRFEYFPVEAWSGSREQLNQKMFSPAHHSGARMTATSARPPEPSR